MLSSNAEKIYWLSRYVERAENTARLVNVSFDLLLDIPHDSVSDFIHLVEDALAKFCHQKSCCLKIRSPIKIKAEREVFVKL